MKLVLILTFALIAGGSAIAASRAMLDQATTSFTASIDGRAERTGRF